MPTSKKILGGFNMKKLRLGAIVLTAALLAGSLVGCGNAQTANNAKPAGDAKPALDYPKKPIELIVPMSAGGGSDVFARQLVKILADEKIIPQTITVVNKPGGSGAIGWAYVAEKKGDPYILSTTSSSFYTVPITGGSPVSLKNFTPISGLGQDPNLLMVNINSKYNTLDDLIAAAKSGENKVSAAGSSGASDDAIIFNILSDKTGTKMKYVPFTGGGEVMTALLGGHVDFAFVNPSEGLAQIEAKKLKALAVSADARLTSLPEIPTFKEKGLDITLAQLRGVVAPLDVDPAIVKYLEDAFKKASETQAWKDFLKKNGVQGSYLNAADYGKKSQEVNKVYEEYITKMGMAKK
jgi:putative tricarboxylic transport membrane protein